ncbi:MAG: DUF5698 domain-containing protein [Bacilli bacterium]|nr:DUF5698 domain-containing protein [Bacilli bacterium]MDD4282457.1 DUF5698 domain-containing protein [Bacilli bacterium]MDD4718946.1 DUF5698 domain-containing protein [Bacilli bacterium]
MNIGLYAIIFISKVIENSLGTLRLIVVANGKKGLGAFLQFIIAIVWVVVTGAVVTNITEDPLKIVFFALGSFVGSYAGSFIEEKMALGSNMLMAIVDEDYGKAVIKELRNNDFAVTVLQGEGKDKGRNILMIMVSRKKRHEVVHIINSIDNSSMIIAESAKTISGGYNQLKKEKK